MSHVKVLQVYFESMKGSKTRECFLVLVLVFYEDSRETVTASLLHVQVTSRPIVSKVGDMA